MIAARARPKDVNGKMQIGIRASTESDKACRIIPVRTGSSAGNDSHRVVDLRAWTTNAVPARARAWRSRGRTGHGRRLRYAGSSKRGDEPPRLPRAERARGGSECSDLVECRIFVTLAPKVILHSPVSDEGLLDAFVEQCLRDRVSLIAVVGPGCARLEELIDEIVVGDGADPDRFVCTTSHPDEPFRGCSQYGRTLEPR